MWRSAHGEVGIRKGTEAQGTYLAHCTARRPGVRGGQQLIWDTIDMQLQKQLDCEVWSIKLHDDAHPKVGVISKSPSEFNFNHQS